MSRQAYGNASNSQPEMEEHLQCSICLELLCQPLRLPCSHTFCRACLSGAFKRESRCPLCRASIPEHFDPDSVVVDRKLESILQRKCTVEYHQRLKETAAAAARTIQLRIGNRYECTGNWRMPHQWTVFVDMETQRDPNLPPLQWGMSQLVEKVRFILVPACKLLGDSAGMSKEPEVSVAPFEVTGTSWGLFTVHIQVFWKSWLSLPMLQLEHALEAGLDMGGTAWNFGVDLGAAGQLVAEGLPMQLISEEHTIESEEVLNVGGVEGRLDIVASGRNTTQSSSHYFASSNESEMVRSSIPERKKLARKRSWSLARAGSSLLGKVSPLCTRLVHL